MPSDRHAAADPHPAQEQEETMTTELFASLCLFAIVTSITPGPNNAMLENYVRGQNKNETR